MNYNEILAKLPPLAQSYQNMGIPQALNTREVQQVPNGQYQLGTVDRYSPLVTGLQKQNVASMKEDANLLSKLYGQQAALQSGYDSKLAELQQRFADNPDKLARKTGKQETRFANQMGKIDSQLAPIQAMPYYQQLMDTLELYPIRREYATGGAVDGPGTGTSDSVPATIDGAEPAALSNNEFVFTELASLGFGEGDIDKGHDNLMRLMKMAEEVGKRYVDGNS